MNREKQMLDIIKSYENEHDTVFKEWEKDIKNYKQLKRNVAMAKVMLHQFEEDYGFDFFIEEIIDELNENLQ